MFLILDTETTGFGPSARIVSISWALQDGTGSELCHATHLIYPEGFTIPAAATAVHGISTAKARKHGIPAREALSRLREDISQRGPTLYVGHNVGYDRPIVLREFDLASIPENLSPLPVFCTMENATHICRLPGPRGRGYKWPKLGELHRHLFGRDHESAHDARGDVCATARCFFELRSRGLVSH
jgi:DNA polymerase III epsilon subunit-like protein